MIVMSLDFACPREWNTGCIKSSIAIFWFISDETI